MSNDLTIPSNKPNFLAKTQGSETLNEFAGGVAGGGMPLPQLSIRAKQFRARLDDEERNLGSDGTLEVILVAARPYVSKRYFEDDYTPGENDAPVCSSIDGKTPDVAEPVNDKCSTCPKNVFGSKGNGKACADYKRLVVLPLIDGQPVNEPVVLDVPATSLKTPKSMRGGEDQMLKDYMTALARNNVDPTHVVSQISFTGADYPQLCWKAVRYVEEGEYNQVQDLRQSEEVTEVLGDDVHTSVATPQSPDPTPDAAPTGGGKPAKKPEPEPTPKVWVHDAANEKVWQAPGDQVPEGCKVVSEAKAQKLKAVYEDDEGESDQTEPGAGQAEPASEPAQEASAGEPEGAEENQDDILSEVENLLGDME